MIRMDQKMELLRVIVRLRRSLRYDVHVEDRCGELQIGVPLAARVAEPEVVRQGAEQRLVLKAKVSERTRLQEKAGSTTADLACAALDDRVSNLFALALKEL